MTCLEKLAKEKPRFLDGRCLGGAVSCPSTYGYMGDPEYCIDGGIEEMCRMCWQREIPEPDETANPGAEKETVNHPAHYQGKYECIEEMLSLFGIDAVIAFCKLNVYKYRFRANQKNGQNDIEKAEWYMTKLKELQWEKENDY